MAAYTQEQLENPAPDLTRQVRDYMAAALYTYLDQETNEIDTDALAEDAADHFELYMDAVDYDVPQWVYALAGEVAEASVTTEPEPEATTEAREALAAGERISLADMEALVRSGVVALKGYSGQPTTVEIAAQAPGVCQAHSSAGDVYDLEFDGQSFILSPAMSWPKHAARRRTPSRRAAMPGTQVSLLRAKKEHTAAWHRCVDEVKAQGGKLVKEYVHNVAYRV